MKNQFIAHLREKDKAPQFLWDHLSEVSTLAAQFAEKIGLKELGEILGLLHDLGKASKEFQSYICSATGIINPDEDEYVDVASKKGKVDHSSAGAQAIYSNLFYKGTEGLITAQVLSLCIASHHSGLIDCIAPDGENNFMRRIEKSDEKTHLKEALIDFPEIDKKLSDWLSNNVEKVLREKLANLRECNDSKETLVFKYGLLIRFLFSCLIDADRLSTADFELPSNVRFRNYGLYQPWEILKQRLDNKLKEFKTKENKNEVDELRNQVSQSCLDFSSKPRGLYQLSVPTGGGKTLASLRFALNHAAHHKMERIFYIIPYTSIIDQNADEIRKILEDRDNDGRYLDRVVLEHHSNLTPEEESRRHNLLSENWDAPIVFTTQVQFLETLFGSGTRSVRRMHQLANSVIIFDEVQTIPIRCVHMFNLALRFLVHGSGSTVVLCTATQPLLDKVEPVQRSLTIQPEQRMIANEKELFKKLRRVDVFDRRKIGGWTDEEVAELAIQGLRDKGSALIIVNTKNSARTLCQTIAEKKIAEVYHLSTNMCPAHRLDVLSAVKDKLAKKEPVICVSTQLIEAGVDIDFGSVIRYLAGIDSIIQAAGRCNRNGRQMMGNVWIVNPCKENIERLKDIRIGIQEAERVLDEFNNNPEAFENDRLGLVAMATYYKYYFYQRKGEMKYIINQDSPAGREDDLFNLLSTNTLSVAAHQWITNALPTIPFKQSFQTAAKAFYAIDSPTRGVVVPYGEVGEQIVYDLCGVFDIETQYRLLKKAQRYSVNLFPHELKMMAGIKAIQEVQEGSGVLYLDSQYYSDQFGWSGEIVNDMKTLIC
jgi:CRISPR-associated endonuclease/helicase Cas3